MISRRIGPVVATVLVLAVAPLAAADPVEESLASLRAVAGPQLSYLVRPGQPALRTVTGRLTVEPTADLRGAATRFLAQHARALGLAPGAALRFDREVPLSRGAVLRYREYVGEIPVVRGQVALRFDGDGILRLVNSSLRPFAAVEPPAALVGSADAVAAALELPGLAAAFDPERIWAGLVYYPVGDEARLAWQIETGAVPALLANWVVWIDARTGELLGRENRVWFDRLANVFEENPVATPAIVQTTLDDLPAWTADPYYLTGELLLSRNCIDRHELTLVEMMGFSLNVHICSEVQVAAGDENHDFLFTDNTDTAPEDLFAEAAMFFHAMKVYDYFQGLGFGELPTSPLAASVNFRIPIDAAGGGFDLANMTDPNGTLYPFDNAMFMPAGEMSAYLPRDMDSIVFGQGTLADFSYDGDIVYHEFTHAVTWAEINWFGATLDDQGLDIGPGALSEAYSDIFSMFITEDPRIGDYGGAGLAAGGAIRDLENDARCPDDMIGEVHQDSVPFSSAAWEVWQLHGAAVVQPYYDALMTLVSDSDFAQASAATLAELSSALGATVAAEARAEFERRNVLDCRRILDANGRTFAMLMGEGTNSLPANPYVPGYAMFRVTVPAGQRQVRATFQAQTGGMFGGTFTPHLVWRKGPDPLAFSYRGATVTDNADYRADAVSLGGNRYEGVYCETDRTLDPGDYFVMIANRGGATMTMSAIRITYNDSEPDAPCVGGTTPETDGGADVPADVPADAPADTAGDEGADGAPGACDPTSCDQACRDAGHSGGSCIGEGDEAYCGCDTGGDDGCGCRAAGAAAPAGGLLALLLGLGLLAIRRRR